MTLHARPRRIAALDVPVAQVEADALRKLAARLDPELRHQILDLDPDSTCPMPGATCPACPPRPIAYLEGDIAIDLTRDWADVLGNDWTWTGQRNTDGQPLMRSGFVDGALPLDVLYADHGPLIPLPVRPTANVLRAGFESGAA